MDSLDERAAFAGFWIRLMANILDGFIMGIPLSLLIAIYYGDDWLLNYSNHSFLTYILFVLAIVTLWLTWNGQTPGKKMMGIRVVSYPEMTNISSGAAWVRCVIGYTLSAIILGFGYLMIAFRQDKRGLHDMIAGTCVIQVQGTDKSSNIKRSPELRVVDTRKAQIPKAKSYNSDNVFSMSNIILFILIIILINILFNFENFQKLFK